MKRVLLGLVIGLALLEAGRRLHRPPDDVAAAGGAAYAAGDFARAEACFRQAEQGAANPSAVAHNRAAALYRLRRFEDADRAYERSADGEALHAARAAYDRGNCAFGAACREKGTADPALLERAAEHYEACLAREGSTPAAGSLFDDARHNLELTRLILAEFAESDKDPSAADRSEAERRAGESDDPFAPSNAAHPPRPGEKEQQKASESQANADPKQTRECKQCKRGGCPKCKKNPVKGPGQQESHARGDGPKPSPGDADNGKGPSQANNSSAGKGKPGQGGKPNPGQKNGVGDARAQGTGPADPGARAAKKSPPSEGKAVGPDGVTYERQSKPGGQGGGHGEASGEARQPRGPGDQPRRPPAHMKIDELFRPGEPRPGGGNDPGSGGTGLGQGRTGSARSGGESDETDGSGDPAERAAARRLRQAIQRIQNAREGRQPPAGAAPGQAPGSDRRRDW